MPATIQIAVVDDEASIRSALERCFMVEDAWDTVSFSSAESALAWLKDHSPDIIISDERMPGLKGSEFLALVRTSHPDVPRIILTGQADQAATIRAINDAGVFRFLCKPWDNNELIAVVKSALDHARSLHKDTELGLQLLKQRNELAEANRQLAQVAKEQQLRLEQSAQAMKQLAGPNAGHRADLMRVILSMTALQSPELVQLGRAILDTWKELGPAMKLPQTQSWLDAALLAGLLSDVAAQQELLLAKLEDFTEVLGILQDMREHFNGTGPRCLASSSLRSGCRLLRIIHDYHKFNMRFPNSGILQLAKESYRIYDPDLVAAFRQHMGLSPS